MECVNACACVGVTELTAPCGQAGFVETNHLSVIEALECDL